MQPALNTLQRDPGVAVFQTFRHAVGHRRQECTPATGRIEHSRRTPIDTGLRRHVQQPFAQCRRRVVGPKPHPEPVRHQSGVEHSNRVAGVQDIQPGRGDSDSLRLFCGLLRYRSKPDFGRQFAQRPPSTGHGPQFLPVRGHHAQDDRPREVQPLFTPDRDRQLPDARRPVFHNRPRQWFRAHAGTPGQVHRLRRNDASITCFNAPRGVSRRTDSAEVADPPLATLQELDDCLTAQPGQRDPVLVGESRQPRVLTVLQIDGHAISGCRDDCAAALGGSERTSRPSRMALAGVSEDAPASAGTRLPARIRHRSHG